MLKNRTYSRSLFFVLFWFLIAVIFGIQNYFFYKYQGENCNFWGTIVDHVPTLTIWALFSPFIQILLERYPIIGSSRKLKNYAYHLLFATLFGIVWIAIIGTGRFFLYGQEEQSWLNYIIWFSSIWFLNQYVIYFVMVVFIESINLYQNYREKESQHIQLQKMLIESQLNTLRMQLQPHFLFNTLNTISMFVRMDHKKEANKVIGLLAKMLRHVLEVSKNEMNSLEDELQFVKNYLEIEKHRFQEKLNIEYQIQEYIEDVMVPTLLLQPIVENCIKHGMNYRSKLSILISAQLKENFIHIVIKDDGSGFDLENYNTNSEGIGLKNTIERCEAIYGMNAMNIISAPGQGTEVIFNLEIK